MNNAVENKSAWEIATRNLKGREGETFKNGTYRFLGFGANRAGEFLLIERTATGSQVRVTRRMIERIHAENKAGKKHARQRAGNKGGISYTVAIEFFVREALAEIVVVVSCTKKKLPHAAAARDLYSPSLLFRKARKFAEIFGDRWLILSALHGVVRPETRIAPYDVSLSAPLKNGGLNKKQREEWAKVAATQLEAERVEIVENALRVHFVTTAGSRYMEAFKAAKVSWESAFANAGVKGLGDMLRFLDEITDAAEFAAEFAIN